LRKDNGKTGDFWHFWDGFKSWSAPSFVAEVMADSEFGLVVLSWVGCIRSCTEIMLLQLRIVAQ